MKTILCYGDSNTWGWDPSTQSRYDSNTRWPMKLAKLLGADYSVVEEGQNGRTICRDDPVEGVKVDKNGSNQLLPILESHHPIDIVVVMLGTNDLKQRFVPSPYDLGRSAGELVTKIKQSGFGPSDGPPKVLLVCPPPVSYTDIFGEMFGAHAIDVSKELPKYYKQFADESGADAYLDAGTVITSSPLDGIHLSAESQGKLAEAAAKIVAGM